MPTVSVIIPTHNRPYLILRAIKSVLNQTFQDFEIIVVDDGTKERAENAVLSLHDDRIVYIKHEINRGAPAARNTGLAHARGKYIALLDDDDECFPRRLELQVEALDKYPEVGLVFSSFELCEKNRIVDKLMTEPITPGSPKEELLRQNFIFNTTIMIRKSCLEGEQFFDENFPKNQEWDLVLCLMERTKFLVIPEKLVRAYVLSDGEHLGSISNMPNIIRANDMLVTKHATLYAKYKKSLAFRYFSNGLLKRDYGDFSSARRDLFKAWRLDPFSWLYAKNFMATLLGKKIFMLVSDLEEYGPSKIINDIRNFSKQWYRMNKNNTLFKLVAGITRKVRNNNYFQNYLERSQAVFQVKLLVSKMYDDRRMTKQAEQYIHEFKKKELFKLSEQVFGSTGHYDVLVLYVLTRIKKPTIVLETGVASGRSSHVILEALATNGTGGLYSIDLPKYFDGTAPHQVDSNEHGGHKEYEGFISSQKTPGWLVPQVLRSRWHLLLGDSKILLPDTLDKFGDIDMFFHDSDHSYDMMTFEYNIAWPKILPGGFLLSDDIKWNNAFNDFIENNHPSFHETVGGFGVALK